MALPIEATPELDKEETIWLLKRMEQWEKTKVALPEIQIDPAALEKSEQIIAARRATRLEREAELKKDETDEPKKEEPIS